MTDIESLRFQLEVEQRNYTRNAEELIRQRDEARAEMASLREKMAAGAAMVAEQIPLLDSLRQAHLACEAERASEKSRADKAEREMVAVEVLRAEAVQRAEKAERDLGERLAATNEVLKDALEQGKESDAPNQALVKAVRAAYRLGAEEMRGKANQACRDRACRAAEKKQQHQIADDEASWRAWFYDQATSETLASIVGCIPLPGDAL